MKVKKKGFTLVEIIVVVSTIGIIMMVVTGTILQIMKAQNRNRGSSEISEQGNWILSELRKNVFNSGNISCASDNLSIGITNLFNGASTILSCDLGDNAIASRSGKILRNLNSSSINITNCDNFVTCVTYEKNNMDVVTEEGGETGGITIGNTGVSAVVFNFGIGTSVAGIGVSQNFTTTVTLRN